VGTRVSLGVMRLGHEANFSPPSSVEVKNEWSHTSASHTYILVCTVRSLTLLFLIYFMKVRSRL
jgi:hypothetical protein